MSEPFHIVVCGSIVPDPLQTLEPVSGPTGPALKNEMMLPAVLDPWAGHALFEAAHLAQQTPGQQGLAGQPRPEGEAPAGDDDGRAEGALRAGRRSTVRPAGSRSLPRWPPSWPMRSRASPASTGPGCSCSAAGNRPSRGAGATLQLVGERLGIVGPVPGRGRAQGAEPTARSRCSSGSRADAPGLGVRRRRPRCSAGPPASSPSRPTIRRSAWPTCGPSCRRSQRAKPAKVAAEGVDVRPGRRARPAARDADRQGPVCRRDRPGDRRLDQAVAAATSGPW